MKVILTQTFPLGRFHATPWKVFPYDDPHGEWPPSPWRLLRALLARSHQLERETGHGDDGARTRLVQAIAQSTLAWHVPAFTWRGPCLRQYQPAEFKKMPAAAKEPGMYTYNTTKVQDNFWLTDGEDQPLYWVFEGEGWDAVTLDLLDACLARMTYFGRAESITTIERIDESVADLGPAKRCELLDQRTSDSVPVLCPSPDVTLDQLQLTTDDKAVRNSTVPPGAVWKFAVRPKRPAATNRPRRPPPDVKPVPVLQFALGSRVAPTLDHLALIANWFRGRTVKQFLLAREVQKGAWANATAEQRDAVALLAGKSPDGKPLQGHRHAYFGFSLDPETGNPSRLLAWRNEPFSAEEQNAIRKATAVPFTLGYREKGQEPSKRDPWKVNCVPLDSAVPLPPGFDPDKPAQVWESLTPYVPPRHAFDDRGKQKPGEGPAAQLARDLERLGFPKPKSVELLDHANAGRWVKVHGKKRSTDGPSNLSKRGYRTQIVFEQPIHGPLALGQSSHFGLGLFVPMSGADRHAG